MGEPHNFVSMKSIQFSLLITSGTLDLKFKLRKKVLTLIHKLKGYMFNAQL